MAFTLTRLKLFTKELGRVCGGRLAVSAVLATGVSLTESAGILLLAPLLNLAGAGSMPGFWPLPFRPTLETVLALYAALVAARSVLAWFASVWNLELEHEFMHDLRVHIFSAAAGMEWRSWARQRSSHFLNAATVETERVGEAVHAFLSIVNGALLAAVYSAFAFYVSWKLSLLALVSSAVLFLVLKNASRRVTEDGENISAANDDLFHAAKDHLRGMKWIRQNAYEAKTLGELETASESVRRSNVRAGVRFGTFRGFLEIAAALGLAATAYLALAIFKLPLASVLLYLVIFSRIAPRLMSVQQDWHEFAGRLPSFARAHAKTKFHEIFRSEEEAFEFSRELRFERISFSYSETGSVLFRDASFRIARKSLVVVTGASGAGKTTLVDLASGLLFPESGHIEVDGRILTPENARSWRDCLAVVTQDAFLFDDSVRANLLWAAPDASDQEMEDALKTACSWDFVKALPLGLNAMIGDNGIRLSGGERQRLALARAILKKPALFILDEPVSALDSENTDRILNNFLELSRRAAVLCLMHKVPPVLEDQTRYEIADGSISFNKSSVNLINFMLK